MNTANIEFVREAYDAIARGDIAWMEAPPAPDVVFFQGGRFPTAGTYHGREAMFGHFVEFMTLVGGQFSIELRDLLASDDRVAAVIEVTIGLNGEQLGSTRCICGASPTACSWR